MVYSPAPPLPSMGTLSKLIRCPAPAPAGSAAQRRLSVVRSVVAQWCRGTNGGYDTSGLAPHFFDETCNTLEAFLYHGSCLGLTSESVSARTEAPCSQSFHSHRGGATVAVFRANELSYDHFVAEFLAKNQPVLVRGATSGWRAVHDWVRRATATSKQVEPNLEALGQRFGDCAVPVQGRFYHPNGSLEPRSSSCISTVRAYARWWCEQHHGKHNASDSELRGENLYLKDWHFTLTDAARADEMTGEGYYSCPLWFRDDWLHAAPESGTAPQIDSSRDHRFVYLGPGGSETPLHCDVMASYSWSANICGEKTWWLLPPEDSCLLYDCLGAELARSLSRDESLATSLWGGLQEARQRAVRVTQRAGEALFVPSGWYHAVRNEKPTLSINHNWLNAFNLVGCTEHVLRRTCMPMDLISDDAVPSQLANLQSELDEPAKEAKMLRKTVEQVARAELSCLQRMSDANNSTSSEARYLLALVNLRAAAQSLCRFGGSEKLLQEAEQVLKLIDESQDP